MVFNPFSSVTRASDIRAHITNKAIANEKARPRVASDIIYPQRQLICSKIKGYSFLFYFYLNNTSFVFCTYIRFYVFVTISRSYASTLYHKEINKTKVFHYFLNKQYKVAWPGRGWAGRTTGPGPIFQAAHFL
ncbi:hypothetical protein Hanom_Chr00s116137g01809641 [Helianthus anomalus]